MKRQAERTKGRARVAAVEEAEAPPWQPERPLLFGLCDSRRGLLLIVLAVALAAGLALPGLTKHVFWDDEANTALFARNLLAKGSLTAWDGTNLVGYNLGAELDDRLSNVYMPPLQYWVAAFGQLLFGETTFSGRIFFALAGIASVLVLAVFVARFFGRALPSALPACILGLCPAYLLFIRNCRYYSLASLFTLSLLAAWCCARDSRRGLVAVYVVGVGSAVLLTLSNYIDALALFLAMPLFFLLPEWRTKRHLKLLAAVTGAVILVGLWILIFANPFGPRLLAPGSSPQETDFLGPLLSHLKGLATFELMPVALFPLLALPFAVKRLAPLRPFVLRGLVIAGVILVSCIVTAFISPLRSTKGAIVELRQSVPLIPLGCLLAALSMLILWRLWKPLAPLALALTLFTNIPHLAFLGTPESPIDIRRVERGPRCTLCEYAKSAIAPGSLAERTSNDAIVDYLKTVPEGSVVMIHPPYLLYAPMFYVPRLRYCCQIFSDARIRPEVKAGLPKYLFWDEADIDLAIYGVNPPKTTSGHLRVTVEGRAVSLGTYHLAGNLDALRWDFSRPEIPWHSFSPATIGDNAERGFLLLKVDSKRAAN